LVRCFPLFRIAHCGPSWVLLTAVPRGPFRTVFSAWLSGFLNERELTDEASVVWVIDFAEVSAHFVKIEVLVVHREIDRRCFEAQLFDDLADNVK